MRNTLPLLAFLILSTLASAQSTASWGIELYPNMTSSRLIGSEQLSEKEIRAIDSLERGRPSWSAGLFASWRAEKVGFEIGLGYMNAGYRTTRQVILPGAPDEALGEERRDVFEGHYLEVPIQVSFYQRLNERNEFLFSLGTGISYNLSNFSRIQYYGGEDGPSVQREKLDKEDFRPLNYAIQAGMGWEHAWSPRMTMVVQPNFKLWLNGMMRENPFINRNLYSVGLRLAFRWHYGAAL